MMGANPPRPLAPVRGEPTTIEPDLVKHQSETKTGLRGNIRVKVLIVTSEMTSMAMSFRMGDHN